MSYSVRWVAPDRLKAPCSFKMLETTHPTTQHHITESLNSQVSHLLKTSLQHVKTGPHSVLNMPMHSNFSNSVSPIWPYVYYIHKHLAVPIPHKFSMLDTMHNNRTCKTGCHSCFLCATTKTLKLMLHTSFTQCCFLLIVLCIHTLLQYSINNFPESVLIADTTPLRLTCPLQCQVLSMAAVTSTGLAPSFLH
jgi:hypothetical protein